MKTNFFWKIYDFSKNEKYFYIIEELQGPVLSKFLDFNSNIDIITAYNIEIQFIMNFKIMHNKGFLHIDTKEDNITSFLIPKKIDNIDYHFTLIDFWFSHGYQN